MKDIRNVKEFVKLCERYETIKLEEIKKAFENETNPQKKLTGFGCGVTCTLCKAIVSPPNIWSCNYCVWSLFDDDREHFYCVGGDNVRDKTYNNIRNADNPNGLLSAYRGRAKLMRQVMKDYPEYFEVKK